MLYRTTLNEFKANWNNAVPDDACEVTSYGEVEDYFVYR